ncbi:MAG: TIGR03899 family protein [Parashewanella sp.]
MDNTRVSAQRKVLYLGKQLGLASEEGYKPSDVSAAVRGEHRARKQLANYQNNLERIYKKALEITDAEVTGIDLDPDWLHNFFQMAEQIHSPKMQELWARILAKEVVNPGNFSIHTLTTLKQLTQREAQVLEKALSLACTTNNETRLKLINGYRLTGGLALYFRKTPKIQLDLSQFGLPYSNILSLINAGIIHPEELETGLLTKGQEVQVTFARDQHVYIPKRHHLLIRYYRLTAIGNELAQLVTPKQDNKFTATINKLFNKDFIIS